MAHEYNTKRQIFDTRNSPNHLHRILCNLPFGNGHSDIKAEQRMLDKQAWRTHTALMRDLPWHPYDRCVCDVLGLDEEFQVVKDPDSSVNYAHRPDCLAYPEPEMWKIDVKDPVMHAAYIQRIQQFRATARSKGDVKKFTQKALSELRHQCGLKQIFHLLPSFHCCRSAHAAARSAVAVVAPDVMVLHQRVLTQNAVRSAVLAALSANQIATVRLSLITLLAP
ncbi:MAG: hypothetical protein Q9225_007059 [Loekoesia sp. 1 TL-2023]